MPARLMLALILLLTPAAALAQPPVAPTGAQDFDWEIGAWTTRVRVRAPLQPDAAWTEFDGTSDVRALGDGRANTVDLALRNAGGGRIEGVALRLFNPRTGQWNINFASLRDGVLTAPIHGAFADGQGRFVGQDTVDGRTVLVRFVITRNGDGSARFVQAYSADGGTTWVDNWIAVDTRR